MIFMTTHVWPLAICISNPLSKWKRSQSSTSSPPLSKVDNKTTTASGNNMKVNLRGSNNPALQHSVHPTHLPGLTMTTNTTSQPPQPHCYRHKDDGEEAAAETMSRCGDARDGTEGTRPAFQVQSQSSDAKSALFDSKCGHYDGHIPLYS
ncbi:hypothetical protein Acr_18g0007170 [Actinidia rufa]|uniref:Uncharacterized protein n=1 Tax=Actinidia rufa TaxID=165716 RepID=A0A7J0G702_9ERIC|nr:hypothetical protein Acr_18g0006950 [Actinidia rufa]GFZ06547.1 hypothetical protein Acr_18g0007170 [Actinidia rufa]